MKYTVCVYLLLKWDGGVKVAGWEEICSSDVNEKYSDRAKLEEYFPPMSPAVLWPFPVIFLSAHVL